MVVFIPLFYKPFSWQKRHLLSLHWPLVNLKSIPMGGDYESLDSTPIANPILSLCRSHQYRTGPLILIFQMWYFKHFIVIFCIREMGNKNNNKRDPAEGGESQTLGSSLSRNVYTAIFSHQCESDSVDLGSKTHCCDFFWVFFVLFFQCRCTQITRQNI